MSKIHVRLYGGLGNQIFQFAAALSLVDSQNCSIFFDTSALGSYKTSRELELSKVFDLEDKSLSVFFKQNFLLKIRLPRFLAFIPLFNPFISDKNYRRYTASARLKNIFLDGYFQTCLNQFEINERISLLKPFIKLKDTDEKKRSGCVIHIRGGDFVKLGWDTVTPAHYYKAAVNKMMSEYSQSQFYIVSDDRDYASQLFSNIEVDYKFISEDLENDFFNIGLYEYRILSASTFAFWASALGRNEKTKVIAPSFWSPGVFRSIYLPNEERLENY